MLARVLVVGAFARVLVVGAFAALLGACTGVECGEGTFSSGNDCIGHDPNDKTPPVTAATPPGGRSREALPDFVLLASDEPARIYFTTDGTDPDPETLPGETSPVTVPEVTQGMTLKWLAVDRAGNREEIKSATYDSDTTPPAPPAGFTVTLTGTTADLSWTAPSDPDYAGVAVARVGDVIDVGPTDGMTIAPGMLSSSVQVLQAGAGTTVSDPGRTPGPTRYVAWAYDDLGNYSGPVVATASLPIGSLTAQLTYDTTTMTLATPIVPANISLAGTSAMLSGTTLTISLQVTNNTTKYFHNFKAEVTAAANATFTNSDGMADTFPFKSLATNLFAPDATTTTDLVFTVTSGTTATIDLTLADHTTVVLPFNRRSQAMNVYDLGSGIQRASLATTIRGPNDRVGGLIRKPVLTGQRYLDVPQSHGAIERFDLVTGMRTGFAPIGIGDRSNVLFLISTGGELIACVKQGGKSRAGRLELVRLDEGLRIRSRTLLSRQDDRGWMIPALAPDGRTLAIALSSGGVLLVDLVTFAEVDAVPSSPVIDLVPTGLQTRPRGAVWFDNGNGLLVPTKNSGAIAIVERTATGWSSTVYQDASTGKGYAVTVMPNGKIWVGLFGGLREFDPATKQFTTIPYAHRAYAIEIIDGETWITRQQNCCTLAWSLDLVSPTGTILRTITLPTSSRAVGHWIGAAR